MLNVIIIYRASLPVPPAPVLVANEEILLELRSMQGCLQALTLVVETQQSEIKVCYILFVNLINFNVFNLYIGRLCEEN